MFPFSKVPANADAGKVLNEVTTITKNAATNT